MEDDFSGTFNYDKWQIEYELTRTLRFEQRQLQLMGLMIALIVLLSPVLLLKSPLGHIIIAFLIILEIIIIGFYFYFAFPRTGKHKLLPWDVDIPSSERRKDYITELTEQLNKEVAIFELSL